MRYRDRAAFSKNNLAKELFLLLDDKKTNLALSADVTSCDELLNLADKLGPEICVLKTHVDILEDFTPSFTKKLMLLAAKHRFFIFEDRKFADIGHTVLHQYAGGMYHIAAWADIINAHAVAGPSTIQGLAKAKPTDKLSGLLLLAEMSSHENLTDPIYAQKTLEMAEQYREFVFGFIAQHKLNNDPGWIYLTPGIQLNTGKDALGQQYITPEMAINHHETDIIIVGRGIIHADDPLAEAKKYRDAGWQAYECR